MSKNWRESLLPPTVTVKEAKHVIDNSPLHIAIIVDGDRRLLGIVTQSDFRKGLLNHVNLEDPVSFIMNNKPTTAFLGDNKGKIDNFFIKTNLMHLPIVDKDGILASVEYYDEHLKIDKHNSWMVIMAGGLGNRLRPLTETVPKPLLKVGERPILENIIINCINYGFNKFYISVNYKSDLIEDYFGDGSIWNVQIEYLREEKKMGTAGALSLLPEVPTTPIFVMNGDIMTELNFQELINFHFEHNAYATMCVKEYDFTVPYGVVCVNGNKIKCIDEKPIHRFFINAGIYIFDPDVLKFIPKYEPLDMPDLFRMIIDDNKATVAFPIHEYWLDIGRIDDYKKANSDITGFV